MDSKKLGSVFDDIDLRFVLADVSGELQDKINSSRAINLIDNFLLDFSHFVEKLKSLTAGTAEDFFYSLIVLRRDFSSAVDHIESVKALLEWTVRGQSSNKVEGQLEVLEEIISSLVKVDLIKVLLYDQNSKIFSSVSFFHQIEAAGKPAHKFVAKKELISDLKASQTSVTIFESNENELYKEIQECFGCNVSSYAIVPMVDSSSQEFKGREIITKEVLLLLIDTQNYKICQEENNFSFCLLPAYF